MFSTDVFNSVFNICFQQMFSTDVFNRCFQQMFSTVFSTVSHQLELSFSHSFSVSLRLAFVVVLYVVVVVVFLHRHSPFVHVQPSHRTSVVVGVGVFKRAHLALLQTLDLAFQKPTTKTTQR
jgi:hypothetical protein